MFFYILGIILMVIILYLLAIMPETLNRPDLSLFYKRYYAHRGFHKEKFIAPENSMAAFQLAINHGFGIEFDIQLSKDRVPVVFHDFNLKRVCGIDKNVNELTFQELRGLTLFDSKEKIPHLKEVIDLVNGQVPLIVEIKSRFNYLSICSIVASYLDNYSGGYCVESFNPLAVLWYKKNRPQVVRGQLSTNYLKSEIKQSKIFSFLLQNLMFNFITRPHFISYNYKYHDNLSFILCKRLYKVTTIAYTIPSKIELDNYLKYFDLFIFENFLPDNPLN
ncbi:glycerophosphodiester phosphodiesterase family protein [uncultured Tissierella sp.]|jgi:glycerophosphoryl diester phosphodiesterase|uniref:glycerophosphodiester phosphodiesterase family protein n=1 Tax=uncultured Tissierella sp. TaxID=448160 RepID=UPI0028043260|nr:glycerophosphodiester phosphodiesterase family protein [uncultured Tissierella sp.]MDU5080066.1 glycerophosphodiester phosphodiesterase family protein [Bacillota bacterium]